MAFPMYFPRRGRGEHDGPRLMQCSMAGCFLSLQTAVAPLGFFVVVVVVAAVVVAAAFVFAIVVFFGATIDGGGA